MKFFIKDFFSKCDQIRRNLMENFIFWAMIQTKTDNLIKKWSCEVLTYSCKITGKNETIIDFFYVYLADGMWSVKALP